MRSAIAIVAIVTFAAGTAFAQQESLRPNSEQVRIRRSMLSLAADHGRRTEASRCGSSDQQRRASEKKIESEEQAKAKIESEGYTDVSALKQNDKGMWTGTAMKDGKPVQLSLNAEGQLSVLN